MKSRPLYIVLELLAGGDLKTFLRHSRPSQVSSTFLSQYSFTECSGKFDNSYYVFFGF